MFQATINSSVFVKGIGVHTGNEFSVTLYPAEENSGIVFVRKDKPDIENKIIADFRNVSDTTMCTSLSNQLGLKIFTIEHLMAALYGLGISNLLIETSGAEIPILDGSAVQWGEAISKVGIKKQSSKRKIIKILKKVRVEDNDRRATLAPAENFCVGVECNFKNRGLETSPIFYDSSKDDFVESFSKARTFGFVADIEYLRKQNIAKGASLENTVVFDPQGQPLNNTSLRYHDEPVRHKVLDAVGDLYLCGGQLIGEYRSYCPGHKMNNLILRKLFESSENYEIVS